jgi:parallel beta-helix repeat protein
VVVGSGATLYIEPGVEVRFASAKGMQIDGTLVARGTAGNLITFTTSSATPTAGAWQFINFTDSSVDATFDGSGNYVSGSVLQYCQVLYAGGSGAPGAIQIQTAAPFIDNCQIRNNTGSGVYATNPPNLRLSNNTISNNTRIGNSYTNNGGGIFLSGGSATITNNTISNNTAYEGTGGIDLRNVNATTLISGNTIAGNRAEGNGTGVGGILVQGNTASVTIQNNTISNNYGSSGYGGAGGGIKVRSNSTAVVIDGNTIASNIFGGGWDDAAGVDLSGGGGPGGGGAPITLTNNTITGSQGKGVNLTSINSVTIRGNTISGSIDRLGSGIHIHDSVNNVVIDNNTIESNSQYGIAIKYGSNTTITGNVVRNNTKDGIRLGSVDPWANGSDCGSGSVQGNTVTGNGGTGAVYVNCNNWMVNNNSIHDNTTTYALYYNGANGTTLNASNNWWGTVDASVIYTQIYDFEDNLLKGVVNFSPIRGSDSTSPILGPANPTISVTGYSGTLADPIVNLALSATSPTQMLISDDHTFPSQFQWETFAATKEFHSDGVTG